MASAHRLTNANRDVLKELARKLVDCPVEAKAENVAYEKADPLVRKLVEEKFPPADMKVLRKYEVARKDTCVYVRLHDGDMKVFNFRSNQEVYVPGFGCGRHTYIADERASAAVSKWVDAKAAFDAALQVKQSKYIAFINSATTFEQVLATWPEAEQVSGRIVRNLPVALSEADVADIAKDSKRRLTQLAKAA